MEGEAKVEELLAVVVTFFWGTVEVKVPAEDLGILVVDGGETGEVAGLTAEGFDVWEEAGVCEEGGTVVAGAGVETVWTALLTVMVMELETAAFPARSLAVAVRIWEPFGTPMVFHEPEYGKVLSS